MNIKIIIATLLAAITATTAIATNITSMLNDSPYVVEFQNTIKWNGATYIGHASGNKKHYDQSVFSLQPREKATTTKVFIGWLNDEAGEKIDEKLHFTVRSQPEKSGTIQEVSELGGRVKMIFVTQNGVITHYNSKNKDAFALTITETGDIQLS